MAHRRARPCRIGGGGEEGGGEGGGRRRGGEGRGGERKTQTLETKNLKCGSIRINLVGKKQKNAINTSIDTNINRYINVRAYIYTHILLARTRFETDMNKKI